MPEFNVNKRAVISGYNNENVIFDGTKSINELKDKSSEGKWELSIEKTVVNDKNEIENTTIYRIKLREMLKYGNYFIIMKKLLTRDGLVLNGKMILYLI